MQKYIWLAMLSFTLIACSGCEEEDSKTPVTQPSAPVPQVEVPQFNADSAYSYVEQQVAFGPRVPGTTAHAECAEWIAGKLREFIGEENVQIQEGEVTLFNGTKVIAKNIIAAINPEISENRILLCAHWDSRMFADHDNERQREPILGANDGGSGVGVLLEMARVMQSQPLDNIGVDIVLFDVEDQGVPDFQGIQRDKNSPYTWCLGSQYWSRNRHNPDQSYNYGILLDMVGANDAVFPQELFSLRFAPQVVQKVWGRAQRLGFGHLFVSLTGAEITDDHYFVNTIAKIPTIDIIHHDPRTGRFGHFWHTHKDDMSVIDRNTLRAVGTTVLHVVYEESVSDQPI